MFQFNSIVCLLVIKAKRNSAESDFSANEMQEEVIESRFGSSEWKRSQKRSKSLSVSVWIHVGNGSHQNFS